MRRIAIYLLCIFMLLPVATMTAQPGYNYSKLQREKLNRGVVAIRENPSEVIVSWRYLSSDPIQTGFNVYRDGKKLTDTPITVSTLFRDKNNSQKTAVYEVRPVLKGKETHHIDGTYTLPENAPLGYLEIPLQKPADGITPAGDTYTYRPNDASIGDVDGDGCDEIIYGSCAIDHNGKGLYTTKMGHGDAIHLTHFDPSRKGLQVWDCHENKRDGSTYRDAATGEILFQIKDSTDVGRCMAADIDPTHPGVEMWSLASGGIRNIKGEVVKARVRGLSCNMAVWWDGDLLRELLDRNIVSKYNWKKGVCERIAIFEGALSNNGTKATPCLQGDIVGVWREEVLLRTADNTALRLYVSTIPTDYRFHTFLEDPVYRISIATQNVAYNQPTQPGFYFGPDLQGTLFRGCKIPKK